jgi:hypothetical protein
MTTQQARPNDISLLLTVFYNGLVNGLITKQEIVAWADNNLNQSDQPEYFFIELSLAADSNELITIISENATKAYNIISARAILGVAYQKLLNNVIDIEKALNTIYSINGTNILSTYEHGYLDDIDEDTCGVVIEGQFKDSITTDALSFLSRYKCFSLANYVRWNDINEDVNKQIDEDIYNANVEFEKLRTPYLKKQKRQRQIKAIIIYAFAVILSLIDINYSVFSTSYPKTKFENDLFTFSTIFWSVFISYHLIQIAKWLWSKLFQSNKRS